MIYVYLIIENGQKYQKKLGLKISILELPRAKFCMYRWMNIWSVWTEPLGGLFGGAVHQGPLELVRLGHITDMSCFSRSCFPGRAKGKKGILLGIPSFPPPRIRKNCMRSIYMSTGGLACCHGQTRG